MKRLPVSAAGAIGKKFGQQQVILVTWEGDTGVTHVVTWGKDKKHCAMAAQGGNFVKQSLNWPDSLQQQSAAWDELQRELIELRTAAEFLRVDNEALRRENQRLTMIAVGMPEPIVSHVWTASGRHTPTILDGGLNE